SVVTANLNGNVYLDESNDDAAVVGSILRNSGSGSGLRSFGYGTLVVGNTVFGNSYGISLSSGAGFNGRVQGNEVYNNSYGIAVSGSSSAGALAEVTGNLVHHNTYYGISTSDQVLVAENQVWGHAGSSASGIQTGGQSTIRNNEVFDNTLGIEMSSYSTAAVSGNRVYRNTTGIQPRSYASVTGNTVYANSIGIETISSFPFYGQISNNLVYANSNQGIRLSGSSGATVTNNTVYQPVGNALLIEGSSSNISLRNNILWVEAGYCISVASNSGTGFSSNRNVLYTGADPNARVGSWSAGGSTIRDTLADWRTATGQDQHSNDINPDFVDLDGADNVLGYTTLGTGYDGGRDDNFYQARRSSAIDAGDVWAAPLTDITGRPRLDDPGVDNTGAPDYAVSSLGSSQFAATGTAMSWRSNGTYWNYTFPSGFTFPLYGATHTGVSVSSEGFLYFSGSMSPGDGVNTTSKLVTNRIIAPLWDNLRTNGTGDDIFINTATAGQVTIRWNATNEANSADVNFAVTLVNDGTIRFHYGSGNTGLSPTVGISRGDGNFFVMGQYDGATSLTNAESLRFALTPGITFVDIGAYEFRGNSNDSTPPQVLGTTPVFIEAGGSTGNLVTQILLTFSEELNAIDANAPANYELRQRVNGTFGDADDVVYNLSPGYTFDSGTGTSVTTLGLGLGGAALPGGTYRLTVFGRASNSLHDTAGNRLDGNRDGSVSGSLADEYVREFVVAGAGITVSAASGDTTEAGGTATFSVVLTREPTANVTVDLSSS
ncbi:MAG: right-handed parallel beta-helix repeat-containing protein, partial [Planctomycetaceae bacterium]